MPDRIASGKFHGAMTAATPRGSYAGRCARRGRGTSARSRPARRLSRRRTPEVDGLGDVGVGLAPGLAGLEHAERGERGAALAQPGRGARRGRRRARARARPPTGDSRARRRDTAAVTSAAVATGAVATTRSGSGRVGRDDPLPVATLLPDPDRRGEWQPLVEPGEALEQLVAMHRLGAGPAPARCERAQAQSRRHRARPASLRSRAGAGRMAHATARTTILGSPWRNAAAHVRERTSGQVCWGVAPPAARASRWPVLGVVSSVPGLLSPAASGGVPAAASRSPADAVVGGWLGHLEADRQRRRHRRLHARGRRLGDRRGAVVAVEEAGQRGGARGERERRAGAAAATTSGRGPPLRRVWPPVSTGGSESARRAAGRARVASGSSADPTRVGLAEVLVGSRASSIGCGRGRLGVDSAVRLGLRLGSIGRGRRPRPRSAPRRRGRADAGTRRPARGRPGAPAAGAGATLMAVLGDGAPARPAAPTRCRCPSVSTGGSW